MPQVWPAPGLCPSELGAALWPQRLSGALEQAQGKAIFGGGRETAQNLAASLNSPNIEAIKHEVGDPDQQARTHPIFESVSNQLEMAVQEITRLRRRQILVKLPGSDETLRLWTLTLPSKAFGYLTMRGR